MDCPWCDVKAGPRALHAHLGEQHGEQVVTSERNGKVFYQVTCPACGARYEHLVRKAARDPEFLAGFGREIRMVALDMLVHHLMAEHGSQDPGGLAAREHRLQACPRVPRRESETVALVNNCNIPEDLLYVVDKHVWARRDGDLVTVGMTDVAQNLAKSIIAVTLKKPGRAVARGRNIATVESGKWVGPVPAPVTGEIAEVNASLETTPGLINSDPYGAGWVARLRPSDWDAESAELASGPDGVEAYRRFLDAEGIACGG